MLKAVKGLELTTAKRRNGLVHTSITRLEEQVLGLEMKQNYPIVIAWQTDVSKKEA